MNFTLNCTVDFTVNCTVDFAVDFALDFTVDFTVDSAWILRGFHADFFTHFYEENPALEFTRNSREIHAQIHN